MIIFSSPLEVGLFYFSLVLKLWCGDPPPPPKKILHLICQIARFDLFRYANKCIVIYLGKYRPTSLHLCIALTAWLLGLTTSWWLLSVCPVLKNTHPRLIHVAQKWFCVVQTVLSFQGPLLSSLWLGVTSSCGLQSRAWLYMCKGMASTVSWAHVSALPYCNEILGMISLKGGKVILAHCFGSYGLLGPIASGPVVMVGAPGRAGLLTLWQMGSRVSEGSTLSTPFEGMSSIL